MVTHRAGPAIRQIEATGSDNVYWETKGNGNSLSFLLSILAVPLHRKTEMCVPCSLLCVPTTSLISGMVEDGVPSPQLK